MKKIKVYIRHSYYSPNSAIPNRKRPEWFDKKKVWENFLETTNFDICDIKVIYDTHFGDSTEEFFDPDTTKFQMVKIDAGTEAGSFLKMLDIVESDGNQDDDIIYFLEDDYLHRKGWEKIMIEGLWISDYISLYDHLDKYKDYSDLRSQILVTTSVHWRTVPSTCNTYACKFSTLKNDMWIHRKYSIEHHQGISSDNSKFLHLGQIGRSLFTPMPGYSTHCNFESSPTIDWESIINK